MTSKNNGRTRRMIELGRRINCLLSRNNGTMDQIMKTFVDIDILNNFNYKAMVEELNVYEIRKFDKLLLKQKTHKSLNSRQYNIVDTKDKVELVGALAITVALLPVIPADKSHS